MRNLALVCVLMALTSTPVLGNDGAAEMATGGLIFVPNRNVEMRSEDLFISMREVRVSYRFFNNAERDITILVAFPYPDFTLGYVGEPPIMPDANSENFIPFTTTVDGQPVKTNVEQRVYGLGIDRTELLRERGIPLAPHFAATYDALNRLPQEHWDEFIALGLAEMFGAHDTRDKRLRPRWTLKTTHYWKQTFPAKSETAIEHRYTPSVGGFLGSVLHKTKLREQDVRFSPRLREYRRRYCVSDKLLADVRRATKAAGKRSFLIEHYVTYILSTALTWAGRIKDFRLVVEVDEPEAFVSFCGTDVRRTGPVRYEMQRQDFRPSKDLQVLFIFVRREHS